MCLPLGIRYSRGSPTSGVTTTLRLPLVSLPKETTPSISVMTACSFGLRASKSSATRGRPPVMSLVLVVSRGIFAMTSPACTTVPSGTMMSRRPAGGSARRARWPVSLEVLPLRVLDRDARAHVEVLVDSMMTLARAGDLVELLLHRDAFDDVAELHHAGDLGEDRHRERIPLGEQLAALDRVAFDLAAWRRRPADSARARARARRSVARRDLGRRSRPRRGGSSRPGCRRCSSRS